MTSHFSLFYVSNARLWSYSTSEICICTAYVTPNNKKKGKSYYSLKGVLSLSLYLLTHVINYKKKRNIQRFIIQTSTENKS